MMGWCDVSSLESFCLFLRHCIVLIEIEIEISQSSCHKPSMGCLLNLNSPQRKRSRGKLGRRLLYRACETSKQIRWEVLAVRITESPPRQTQGPGEPPGLRKLGMQVRAG